MAQNIPSVPVIGATMESVQVDKDTVEPVTESLGSNIIATEETTKEDIAEPKLSKKQLKQRKRAASRGRSKEEQEATSKSGRQLHRRYDSAGFRLRQQILSSAQVSLQDMLGETPDVSALDPSHRVVTIEDDIAIGAKYVYKGDGLRRVPPYYFTYLTYCKQRWRDRNILEIFATEFREKDASYYRQMIEEGQVTINSIKVGLDATVKNGDLISHRTHKHEPPVPDSRIEIVYQDEDIVAIDKPAGIPVHPVGRYKFNTITEIMKHEMGITVHRKRYSVKLLYSMLNYLL